MKKILFLLIALAFSFAAPANAQQNQQLRRSRSIFLYPEFQKAKIRQSFGRFVEAEANIYLKDASLVYKENGKIMRAYTKGIFGVTFADTAEYVKVDSVMARVVAKKGFNSLLCKTTVNMARYREEESGGSGMDFFEMSDFNVFMNMNDDQRDDDLGIPLQDKYYFSVKGFIVPANESDFKKSMNPAKEAQFKELMKDRFWSWRDPKSLQMLLDFLPEK